MRFLIGCDPELFLKDRKTGEFVSAFGIIPGTKYEPHPVEYGAVQVDGNALEFNITPASTKKEWLRNIDAVMLQLKAMLPDHLEAVVTPKATFSADHWNGLPDVCKALGCDPDFNAYTGEINARPLSTLPVRYAGGHIHAGWTEGVDVADTSHRQDCNEVGKQMDYFLGVWTSLWDNCTERREMYGKAGCIRYKPYGCEYRTPSNMWLSTPQLIGYAYDVTMSALCSLADKRFAVANLGELARSIINENITDWPIRFGDTILRGASGLLLPPHDMYQNATKKQKKA